MDKYSEIFQKETDSDHRLRHICHTQTESQETAQRQ